MQTHTSEHPEQCMQDPPQGSGRSSLPRHSHTHTSPVSAPALEEERVRTGPELYDGRGKIK